MSDFFIFFFEFIFFLIFFSLFFLNFFFPCHSCEGCPIGRKGIKVPSTVRCEASTSCNVTFCTDCPKGFFIDFRGQTECKGCLPGLVALTDASTGCLKCEPGRFEVNNECLKCEPGLYQAATAQVSCLKCDAGKISRLYGSSNCTSCAVGKVQASNDCESCVEGKHNEIVGQVACKSCIGGKFAPSSGSVTCTDCDEGKFQIDNQCDFCPEGYHQPQVGQSQCSICELGKIAPKIGKTSCTMCIAGKYESEKIDCVNCPEGFFQAAASQIICNKCAAGKISSSSGQEVCQDCEAGQFDNTKNTCVNCPKGWYQSIVGQAQCIMCLTGYISSDPGNKVCTICSASKYEIRSVRCVDCPSGFYQSLSGRDQCILASDGHYAEAAVSKETICPTGYFGRGSSYSDEGGERFACNKCVAGTYGDEVGLPNVGRCKECSVGLYNDVEGIIGEHKCSPCAQGRFGNTPGLQMAELCLFCEPGLVQPKEGQKECDECSPGQAQQQSGKEVCVLCLPGKFQRDPGQKECPRCNPGFYGTEEGKVTCEACNKGWFQDETGKLKCEACPIGYFTSCEGSSFCRECAAGQTTYKIAAEKCVTKQMATVAPILVPNSLVLVEGTEDVVCLDFSVPKSPDELLLPSKFDNIILETSVSPEFPEEPEGMTIRTNYDFNTGQNFDPKDKESLMDPGVTRACFKSDKPMFNYLLFFRVRGFVQSALGTPSVTSPAYSIGPTCGNLMYLCRHCWPPEGGIGAWQVNASHNKNLNEWICQGCPEGADCRGPKLWKEIQAQYGYMRLGEMDYTDRRNAFQRCFRESACLGARRELPPRERPGTKHAFTTKTRPSLDCCSAVDPLEEDLIGCEKDPENFKSLEEHKRGQVGFDPKSRGCTVDLSLVDDVEQCHVEAGFRLNCSYTQSGKCRLCRACAKGYWPQGVSKCLKCPHPLVNLFLVVGAVFAVLTMLMTFLSSALADTGAEAQSTVIHFSQAEQKILLNHIQLISLASAFPLKWPDEVEQMFEVMSLIGNAGSYMFNPACNDVELVEGESMFFQKQLGILTMPFIAVVCCAVFWFLSGSRDCCDPLERRHLRRDKLRERRRLRREKKLSRLNMKRRTRKLKYKAKVDRKVLKRLKKKEAKMKKKEEKRKKRKEKINSRQTVTAPKLLDVKDDARNILEANYQQAEGKKLTIEQKAREKITSSTYETHDSKIQAKINKWQHLKDESDPAAKDITATDFDLEDSNNQLYLISVIVQPLFPLGIIWEPTEKEIDKKPELASKKAKSKKKKDVNKKTSNLEWRFPAKVKRLVEDKKKTQVFNSGIKDGDYLYAVGKVGVEHLDYEELRILFDDAEFVGTQYKLTVCRKIHKLKENIQEATMSKMKVNQSLITTFDKFIATMVTMLYLLYPTVTKATFQLVACQSVGGHTYLQMDLDIPCFEAVHMRWVVNLFLPALFGYVIGLPLMTLLVLFPSRHHLQDRWTRFRYGVLYSGYTENCFFWECTIATRKASVIVVSVFMTTSGAEAQALCCMMIVMSSMVAVRVFFSLPVLFVFWKKNISDLLTHSFFLFFTSSFIIDSISCFVRSKR